MGDVGGRQTSRTCNLATHAGTSQVSGHGSRQQQQQQQPSAQPQQLCSQPGTQHMHDSTTITEPVVALTQAPLQLPQYSPQIRTIDTEHTELTQQIPLHCINQQHDFLYPRSHSCSNEPCHRINKPPSHACPPLGSWSASAAATCFSCCDGSGRRPRICRPRSARRQRSSHC